MQLCYDIKHVQFTIQFFFRWQHFNAIIFQCRHELNKKKIFGYFSWTQNGFKFGIFENSIQSGAGLEYLNEKNLVNEFPVNLVK